MILQKTYQWLTVYTTYMEDNISIGEEEEQEEEEDVFTGL